uniref:Apple domain-containing protein n=1 Tax=Parastrongyloides trichosuri TaxID=131310 RepID=A0A0N4ZP70_PARTI
MKRIILLLISFINILIASKREINEGHCPLVFNVRKINSNDETKIDSYFINFNVSSINDCAIFCAQRHFCRTADYDPIQNSCSISYTQTLNCYTNYERFSSYIIESMKAKNFIYRITCANYCDSKFNSNPHSSERTQEHKNVINSIHGNEEFGKYIHQVPKIIIELQRKLGGDTEIHTQLIPVERKVEEKIREIKHNNGSLTRQVQKVETEVKEVKGQLIKIGENDDDDVIKKTKGIIEYVEKNNNKEVNVITDDLSKSFNENIVNKLPSFKNFRIVSGDVPLPIQRAPTMKGVKTQVRGDTITYDLPNEPVVVNGRVIGYEEKIDKDGNAVEVFYNSKEYNSHEFMYSSKENIDTDNAVEYCYKVLNQQELMYAGYKRIENISLNECRCACAESWLVMKEPICQSIQYFKDTSICVLNKGDHHGKYDLVYNPNTIYYHTSCTREVFLSTVKSICDFSIGSPKNTIKPAPISKTTTINRNVLSDKITKEMVNSKIMSSEKTSKDCFEVIPGYNMIGVAGGLENNVTLEECKCFCAHGKSLKRFSFQCLSATYFHDQQDCVLNIGDKDLNPKEFVKNYMTNYKVSYIGLTCPFKIMSNTFEDHNLHQCRINDYESKKIEKKNDKIINKNNDDCFVEMPSYVLEGTAMTLETNVTVDECKCFCIDSENRYGIICQSLQYYYDSSTCLLNNENKDSNPEKFMRNEMSDTSHSYFHLKCFTQTMVLSSYTDQVCTNILDQKIQKVELKDEKNKNIDGDLSQDSHLLFSNINQADKNNKMVEKISLKTTKKQEIISITNITTMSPRVTKVPIEMTTRKNIINQDSKPASKTINFDDDNVNDEDDENYIENNEINLEDSNEGYNEISTTMKTTTTTEDDSEYEKTTERVISTTPSSDIGPCTYNALYNRLFNGNKLIKRVDVDSAGQCFQYCHVYKCRSANLIVSSGTGRVCELYKDSIIDYRRADILEFARGGAHFDTIKCQVKEKISN